MGVLIFVAIVAFGTAFEVSPTERRLLAIDRADGR